MRALIPLVLMLAGCASVPQDEQTFIPKVQAWCDENGGECTVTTLQKMRELAMRAFQAGHQKGLEDAKGGS